MQELYDRIARVAPTSAPVLLIGEHGSGKTLVARTLHELSRRKRAPFLMLDCSAVPSHSLEAELFGRDASGGAEQRHVGALERAHGGTVLLAQIGALPIAAQVKLLRFLESGHFVAEQATTPVAADVRIVASTERPLATAIDEAC